MTKAHGFTIIELMTVIAVLGVALAIGVPAMNQFILNNRMVSQLNSLSSALALARSEAVKQNLLTVACASTDGKTCASDADWSDGWIAFVDRNANLTPDLGGAGTDGCADGATADCLLLIEGKLIGDSTLRGAASVSSLIAYNGSGVARCDEDGDGTVEDCISTTTYFVICDRRGAEHARALAVSRTGRTSVIDTAVDGGVLQCTP